MKITMYGAPICPDCVEAKAILEQRVDIELDYRNITESTKTLKEFLAYRDHEALFEDILREGKIGIPFFILEDGTKTFDALDILNLEKAEQIQSACSVDAKGQC